MRKSSLILRMSSLTPCPVCGERTDLPTCPRCGNYLHVSAKDSVDVVHDEPAEVVFLTEESKGEPRGGKRVIANVLRTWYFFGIPIMCAWLAVAGHDRIVFTIGTIFGLQLVYIYLRSKRF